MNTSRPSMNSMRFLPSAVGRAFPMIFILNRVQFETRRFQFRSSPPWATLEGWYYGFQTGRSLAARLALDGTLTVGMIFALVSYKRNFTEKAALLIEKAIEFRVLDLHLERLGDVALTPLEPGHDRLLAYARPIEGRIELRNLCFRYAETEPFVLENVNLVIEAGQFVTIMGPSGGGKTTLVKIMLGLIEPTGGEILIDGISLATIGARPYREHVAAVMQEDQLLSGSIADNICFFDSAFDHNRMVECAQLAGVHDEIMAMPMTYNSLI